MIILLKIHINGVSDILFLALLLLWIIFNGRITGDVLASGIVAVLLVCAFCHRFMGYRIRKEWGILRNSGRFIWYFIVLIKDIIAANIQVIGFILSRKDRIDQCLIRFQPGVKSVPGRVLLASTITLIPGSVTGEMTDDGFTVHALTPEIAKAQQGSKFEKCIREMEGES